MNQGFYINKRDGRRSFFNATTLKLLGSNLLKEWTPEDYVYQGIEEYVKLEDKVVPAEIQEIIAAVVDRKTIKELKDSIAEMSLSELKEYEDDERVTVRRMIEEELKTRNSGLHSEW